MNYYGVYEIALNFTLKWEGLPAKYGEKRNKNTKYGIDQETYDECYKIGLVPRKKIDRITYEEAERVYFYKYWSHIEALTSSTWFEFKVAFFDTVVSFGIPGGITLWQKALGVREDGIWGPVTEKATWNYIEKRGSLRAALELVAERIRYRPEQAKEDGSQGISLIGSLNRDLDLMMYVIQIQELAKALELPF